MKLLYGLGNPDEENAHSRHNAGWMLLDEYGKRTETRQMWDVDLDGEFSFSVLENGGIQTVLCKPNRYMNDQGVCLANALERFCADPVSDLLVLHDDLDLPLGKIRLRQKGSPPSHNGLFSIREQLKTDLFWRLRLGIESRTSRAEIPGEDFVLGDFSPEEMRLMEDACTHAIGVVRLFIAGKLQEAVAAAKKQLTSFS